MYHEETWKTITNNNCWQQRQIQLWSYTYMWEQLLTLNIIWKINVLGCNIRKWASWISQSPWQLETRSMISYLQDSELFGNIVLTRRFFFMVFQLVCRQWLKENFTKHRMGRGNNDPINWPSQSPMLLAIKSHGIHCLGPN